MGKLSKRASAKGDGTAADKASMLVKMKDSALVLFCVLVLLLPVVFLLKNVTALGLLEHSAIHWGKLGYGVGTLNSLTHPKNNHESLKIILNKAAMPDNTVIITTLNNAWATPNSMIDLFLESFRVGERTHHFLKHLVIVALDQKAYDRCLSIHMHCFMLRTTGVDFSGEKFFMTDDYLKMMWRRIRFLRRILQMGYNFIFTDADVMWFRSPFPHFSEDADIHIACDQFTGDSTDLENRLNGGFNFVKSNNRTIHFYKYWYMSREFYPGKHDQDVLNIIKFNDAVTQLGLKMKFLDTAYFGGFCEPSRDLDNVCTMHANCCYGLRSKLHDVSMMLADWKHFQSLSPTERIQQQFTWQDFLECRESEKLKQD